MDELQTDLFSQDLTKETKWKTKQIRVSPEEWEEINKTAQWIGLSYSVINRIIWRILSRRRLEMPQVKDSPVRMIDQSGEEFFTYLPVYKQQQQVSPRSF
jgi:hypothetical protein